MANILKTPVFNEETKILSFDLETNGLHGEAFAVGAVVMNSKGEVLDEFSARTDIIGNIDDWVERNVLPAIKDMEVTHSSAKHLRDNFWSWFLKAKDSADYVLVNNGYPVEYRFLIACQDDDIDDRYWSHPFPILDLTSMLVALKKDVQKVKNITMAELVKTTAGSAHNPLYDSKVACLTAFREIV